MCVDHPSDQMVNSTDHISITWLTTPERSGPLNRPVGRLVAYGWYPQLYSGVPCCVYCSVACRIRGQWDNPDPVISHVPCFWRLAGSFWEFKGKPFSAPLDWTIRNRAQPLPHNPQPPPVSSHLLLDLPQPKSLHPHPRDSVPPGKPHASNGVP